MDEAEREWLESSFGGPLKADTQQRQKHLDELLGNIQQFQIGFIMPLPTPKSIQEPNFLLTKSMLRRYDNPHDGLYTALDGYVYNIAGECLRPGVTYGFYYVS